MTASRHSSRSAPASTRDQIVEVARQELAARGLASMTIRQVARQVGVDPGTIRHYFPSKDDLVHAAAGADIELGEVYDQITAELADRGGQGAGQALIVAALRYLCEEEAAMAAVAVCLTGGDYQSTVFGSFDRDIVTPLAEDLASDDGHERSALVMSVFLGFQLLATLLPTLPHTLHDEDVQAILAESVERHLKVG